MWRPRLSLRLSSEVTATHSPQLWPSLCWLAADEIIRNLKSTTDTARVLLSCKTHPDLKAVMIQSAQKRCRHSLVVIVFFNMSRQIGHMSSLCNDRGDTAISSPSVIASCDDRKQIRMKVSIWDEDSTKFFRKYHNNYTILFIISYKLFNQWKESFLLIDRYINERMTTDKFHTTVNCESGTTLWPSLVHTDTDLTVHRYTTNTDASHGSDGSHDDGNGGFLSYISVLIFMRELTV